MACATSGQTEGVVVDQVVQLSVINEYAATVTAYAVWEGDRFLLGDVGTSRTRFFDAPLRSDLVAVAFQFQGVAIPATAEFQSEPIAVREGDAVEIRLSAAGVITARRLSPGL